jgi:glycosyltransferase involved in cell wall biosynthesis
MTDPADSRAPDHVLDIVIPVYNEERGLAGCIRRLREYVCTSVPYSTRITVADNASTDDTLKVAHRLADEPADVEVIHIDVKGRGAALQTAWAKSSADVVAYVDVDLSTELSALMRAAFGARFSDAQCGFKAVRADVARELLPLVADTGWFFDTGSAAGPSRCEFAALQESHELFARWCVLRFCQFRFQSG